MVSGITEFVFHLFTIIPPTDRHVSKIELLFKLLRVYYLHCVIYLFNKYGTLEIKIGTLSLSTFSPLGFHVMDAK